ncbi:class I SAM-dependent methyltransferase [Leifsonia xyli]|jgi:ubiquinone/menaquinone biosynthesis C-methylase UbiE|nr:methyltransferase domain-containing protein [Leifsonia xyli]
MEHLDAIRLRFDQRSAEYDRSSMHTALAERVAAFAELGGIHDVLDVATGTGLVLRALYSRLPSLRLTGLDLSPGMLAVARAVLPSAELIEADATVLPFPDASADLVTCVTGLYLFSRPGAALAEWVRVLRPGGRAVTATFAAMDAWKHGGGCRQPFPIHHDLFDSPERLAEMAGPSGLAVDRFEFWESGEDRVLLAELSVC